MKSKNYLILVSVLVFIAFTFSACGGSKSTDSSPGEEPKVASEPQKGGDFEGSY